MAEYRFDPQALQQLRFAKGLRVEHLAIATGRSKESVRSWEAGRAWPKIRDLAKLCAYLGCGPADLLRAVEPEKRAS